MQLLLMDEEGWRVARQALRGGSLVAFPTDTVYGIGCDPYNLEAIGSLFAAKGRELTKAIPLLLSDQNGLAKVAGLVPAAASDLARAFWPGALTLVVYRHSELPAELGGGDTIAVRVPDHDGLRRFVAECGGAVAATSANRSGEPDALTADEVVEYFGDKVAVIIDGGRVSGGIPSTVVSCVTEPPEVLREGAVPASEIWKLLGRRAGRGRGRNDIP